MIPAAPPLDPDEARSRVHEELAKSEYDDSPGFLDWLLGLIERWLTDLLGGVDGSSPAQAGIAVLLALLLGAAVVLVLRRTGLLRRSHALSVAAQLDAEPVLGAAQLRRAAREASEGGRHDDATVLALRALVRDLEERTLLEVTAGLTAHEAAVRSARPFPELRGRLQRGADAFDTAAYSHRSATAKEADDLLRLAEYIAETAPELSDAEPGRATVRTAGSGAGSGAATGADG